MNTVKTIQTTTLQLALVLGVFAALPAAAQPPEHRGFHHGGRDIARALDLTEAQREEWRAAHEAHREAIEPLFQQARSHHESMEAALENGNPTEVGEIALAAHALRKQMETERAELEAAILQILDEEQAAQYRELRESRRPRFAGPGFRGHDRGRGPGRRSDQ
jgi:Spy/CpxP family protein refolding chaperone